MNKIIGAFTLVGVIVGMSVAIYLHKPTKVVLQDTSGKQVVVLKSFPDIKSCTIARDSLISNAKITKKIGLHIHTKCVTLNKDKKVTKK